MCDSRYTRVFLLLVNNKMKRSRLTDSQFLSLTIGALKKHDKEHLADKRILLTLNYLDVGQEKRTKMRLHITVFCVNVNKSGTCFINMDPALLNNESIKNKRSLICSYEMYNKRHNF